MMKTTAAATAAVVLIVLQVAVFRIVGDMLTSAVLFGLGYALGRLHR